MLSASLARPHFAVGKTADRQAGVCARFDVGLEALVARICLGGTQDSGKADIHSLCGVGKGYEPGATPSLLLDVLAWTGIVAESNDSSEAIQAVANGDVERLTKDAVPLCRVCNHLSVATGHVEDDRVVRSSDGPSHLDVADAVVDADKRLLVHERERPCYNGNALKRSSHAGTFGVADAVDFGERLESGAAHGFGDDADDPLLVMFGGVAGLEAGARGRDVRVSHIGENLDLSHRARGDGRR